MYRDGRIYIGNDESGEVDLELKMANRHGLIAGATGTGKTVTLKVLAESFSSAGVPVFLADVKGDLSSMCVAGQENAHIEQTLAGCGMDGQEFPFRSYPTEFWDVYGEGGLPLRATAKSMGAMLLARILGLNATQEGVLNAVFRIAQDEGMPLITTEDLRTLLLYANENTDRYSARYGNMAKTSLGAIQRNLLKLESDGGDRFLGVPALDIYDWLRVAEDGRGVINVLDCRKLVLHPIMYATFLLWMLTELYESLPEVGDIEKPKLVFFFDEAHLLFDAATKELKEKVDQVVKLIRSKGVGVYFVTQTPADVPGSVLSQLGNKVQHALRAYTPMEKRGIRTAAESFRANPKFHTESVLEELGIGEALVSCLDERGVPGVVRRTRILPPESAMGQVEDSVRRETITTSDLYEKYTGKRRAAIYMQEEGISGSDPQDNKEYDQPEMVREADRGKPLQVSNSAGMSRTSDREAEKAAIRRKLAAADKKSGTSGRKKPMPPSTSFRVDRNAGTPSDAASGRGGYSGSASAVPAFPQESGNKQNRQEYLNQQGYRNRQEYENQQQYRDRQNYRDQQHQNSGGYQDYPSEKNLFTWIRTAFDDRVKREETEPDMYELACGKAEELLSHQAFSRAGLVRRLEAEDFLSDEAEYAAEQMHADWYSQALRMARTLKSDPYLTKSRLKIMLISEGFIEEEAEYGASKA
ncbi:MAG: DUF853 family protein [Lachnospiraceae bacterium]|nr:DUF853 family protein [Lachnospiraceae bacterium]